MQQTVVGVFDSMTDAQQAVSALAASGVSRDRVQISASNANASAAGAGASDTVEDEGMMSSIKHFFSGLFGDEEDHAAPYAEAVRRGGAIVKVNVDGDEELHRATEALDDAGAVDIDERAQTWRSEGWQGASATNAADTRQDDLTARAPTTADAGVIPVIKESLEVGKRTIGTGGVRVFARTVSEPVNESVDLRSEHAQVTRRPADRPATEADLNALKDRTIEVRETAEKAVVSKTARVVEEVSVGKTVENRTENISDSLRHTEVEVERLAGGNDYDRYSQDFKSDFATRYGSAGGAYADYEPAYRFGHGLRADKRYAGRQWDQVEPDARRDWEAKNPGSVWEKSKDAIRHAWDRVTD
jgi:uncharacterized protein (TIGR02271 family)